MSAFGDHTPKQDLLEAIQGVQYDHDLGLKQLIKMLAEIIAYLLEYSE